MEEYIYCELGQLWFRDPRMCPRQSQILQKMSDQQGASDMLATGHFWLLQTNPKRLAAALTKY